MMKDKPAKLLEEAMKLPVAGRAALASSLFESLDEEVDEKAESEWQAEIARRLRDLDSGKVRPISWAQARQKIVGQ